MRTMQPLYSRIPVVRGECEWCVSKSVRVFFGSMRARSTCMPFFSLKKCNTKICNTGLFLFQNLCSLDRCVLGRHVCLFFRQKSVTLQFVTLASTFFSKISCDLVARAHNSRSPLSSRKSIPARASSKKEDLWRPFLFLFFSLLRG